MKNRLTILGKFCNIKKWVRSPKKETILVRWREYIIITWNKYVVYCIWLYAHEFLSASFKNRGGAQRFWLYFSEVNLKKFVYSEFRHTFVINYIYVHDWLNPRTSLILHKVFNHGNIIRNQNDLIWKSIMIINWLL